MLDDRVQKWSDCLIHLLLFLLKSCCQNLSIKCRKSRKFLGGGGKIKTFDLLLYYLFRHFNLVTAPSRNVFQFFTIKLFFPHFEFLIKFLIEFIDLSFTIIKLFVNSFDWFYRVCSLIKYDCFNYVLTVFFDIRGISGLLNLYSLKGSVFNLL